MLCFVLIGIPLLAGLYIANVVFVIVAAMRANDGLPYRYPYILRLVKVGIRPSAGGGLSVRQSGSVPA